MGELTGPRGARVRGAWALLLLLLRWTVVTGFQHPGMGGHPAVGARRGAMGRGDEFSPLDHSARARRNSILPQVELMGGKLEPYLTRLHGRARTAIREGKHDVAAEIYNSILFRLPSVSGIEVCPATRERTFLLLALHMQRRKDISEARRIFNQGLVRFPHSSKLMVALALMESKHGHLPKARSLVKKAAARDPENCGALLKWKIFQEPGFEASGCACEC